MAAFTIYPAIDLHDGQVIRLYQGDPQRQTLFSDEPAQVARRWIEDGIKWLHVVNLNEAFGERNQANRVALEAILQIATLRDPPVRIQLGGGLRSLFDIEKILAMGVSRVILGTAVIETPHLVKEAVENFGFERMAVAIDTRAGYVQVRGWEQGSRVDPLTLGKQCHWMGVRTAIYTDISRDGTGVGIDLEGARRLSMVTGLEVIVAGGVASLEDVRQASQSGLSGVIIGRSLYQGQIVLKEALAC